MRTTALEATPPDTSPSNRATLLYYLAAAVALVGLFDALYLTVLHVSGETARCTVLTGCSEVLGSSYATVAGFPLAAFGAIAYFTAFSLATLAASGYAMPARVLTPLVATMCVVSLALVGVQAFVIKHFCEFCLLSAGVSFTLGALVLLTRRS